MPPRPRIDTPARRRRLVARHHLRRTADSVESVVRGLVAVHSSDPVTPYLSLWARTPDFAVGDLSAALFTDRSLWRLHAMRRTLFVVAAEDQPIIDAACARDVASAERRKVTRWVGEALAVADPRPWLADVEAATLSVLADGVPRRTQDLTNCVEGLRLQITVGSGRWTTQTPLSSRLLFVLAMEGHLVRAHPAGSWLSSQYHWVSTARWFAAVGHPQDRRHAQDRIDAADGRAALARRWLGAHAPATTADLRWWAGWTVRRTEAALAAIDAVEVDLDDGQAGWVLPDDVDTPQVDAAGVALLPALDPTVMGWTDRRWYLGDHGPRLFDRNGNAGPTIWVDGRVVGAWAQRSDGEVVVAVLEDIGRQAMDEVVTEAATLTAWFDGTVATPRFRSPLERELSAR